MTQPNLTKKEIQSFRDFIWEFYAANKREFAWRNVADPYWVVVSEIMLQQTQTHRVVPKFDQFIAEFSSFEMLAQASLRDVLSLWQGLGYNRRGRYLHELAKAVMHNHNGVLPSGFDELRKLPGIGSYTAGAVSAFAFNKPAVFIETNIRAVYLHAFFSSISGFSYPGLPPRQATPDKQFQQAETKISDTELMPFIAATLDAQNPREWYYALMDYGAQLKKISNPNIRSKHRTVQSKFEGSDRQIRGKIIALLTHYDSLSLADLIAHIDSNQADRIVRIAGELCVDNMIENEKNVYLIAR